MRNWGVQIWEPRPLGSFLALGWERGLVGYSWWSLGFRASGFFPRFGSYMGYKGQGVGSRSLDVWLFPFHPANPRC